MTKEINEEINLIKTYEKEENSLESFDNFQYKLHKDGKRYLIQTNKTVNMNSSKFRLENLDAENFKINEFSIKIISSQIQSSNGIDSSSFRVNKFSDNNFNINKKLQYKLIIPYKEEIKISLQDYFSLMGFMIYINGTLFRGLEFTIKEYTFHIYYLDNFFIIESLDEIDFTNFDSYSRLTLASFGFITGFVPMESGYYFGYENNRFIQYLFDSSFYNTYKTQYNLITTNAYDYYQNIDLNFSFDNNEFKTDSRIEDLNQQLKPIERNVFEILVNNMIEDRKFSEVVFSIISINNLKSFSSFLKAGLYSIVLEMITSVIYNTQESNPEDILKKEHKSLNIELQNKLHEISKDFYKINNFEYKDSIVEKRINGMYTPINIDKLTEAYSILQIPLTKKDKKNIQSRNKFLHGSTPFNNKNAESFPRKLLYINLELNYLVNALVLKHIGYDGIIKNLAKIYLDDSNLSELKEQEYHKNLN